MERKQDEINVKVNQMKVRKGCVLFLIAWINELKITDLGKNANFAKLFVLTFMIVNIV